MALGNNDLKAIKNIVNEAVDSRVTKSETYLKDYVDFSIEKSVQQTNSRIESLEESLDNKLKAQEEKIVTSINREISDLAENIGLVINKVDQIDNHEKRIVYIESKLGIKVV